MTDLIVIDHCLTVIQKPVILESGIVYSSVTYIIPTLTFRGISFERDGESAGFFGKTSASLQKLTKRIKFSGMTNSDSYLKGANLNIGFVAIGRAY